MKKFATLAFAAAALTVIGTSSAFAAPFSPDNSEIVNGIGGTGTVQSVATVDFPKYAAVTPTVFSGTQTILPGDYTNNNVTFANVINGDVRTNSVDGLNISLSATDGALPVGQLTGFVADGNFSARTHIAGNGSNGFFTLGANQQVESTSSPILDSYKSVEIDLRYRNLAHYINGSYSQTVVVTVLPN